MCEVAEILTDHTLLCVGSSCNIDWSHPTVCEVAEIVTDHTLLCVK